MTEERGVYDTPVHGSRDLAEREVQARLAEKPPSDAPMPRMTHEVEGTGIVVEETSGNAAAEASGTTQPDNAAPAAESAGLG